MQVDEYKFSGDVPDYYDRLFGSQVFEPYAKDLLSRVSDLNKPLVRILELGCGTGRCTEQILARIDDVKELIATDISQEMIEYAKHFVSKKIKSTNVAIDWQVVDECDLPYNDNYFDMVVCQFGYMFGNDKEKALAESARVLKPGGVLLFNVWDDIEKNPLCFIADRILKETHPNDHDEFFQLPYSMHDRGVVVDMLRSVGMTDITTMDECMKCYWSSPMEAADAIIDGSPISHILSGRGEDLQPTLNAISSAYSQTLDMQNVTLDTDDDGRVGFNFSAVVYKCFKPTRL
mmetsp:Transcript_2104/g.3982  ORF Transcript_2104/g.3982 Transcript_2104/m.3982 type:complete len:290 (-) Transcript_2104:58-927(-)|eukprot:CAMPEP_0114412238 /NCGR_PEP_ID=MMETSP0103-20121206/217_1 /TAXON_ID=37642 ORGANISM="Paraphysomonas imperforata, Strain PA2" /NCGR_SAMPLE_ID=MMETSP0103 /ASSEMBLY_ACC=CAM_ASM_000201 /LENGTH=289 /DNA_ID=CAMNT_0001580237 /DNA_START=2222 /DNA_END=3091 /DNA_ORIENTATION=-